MAELRIDNPSTTAQFVSLLAALDVKLPLGLHDEDLGVVIDADGCDVFTVDVNSERDDRQVQQIAMWIVLAVNTCGGFRVERGHG
jgi:hypothetical protein